jgi:hypothetical protein
MDNLIKQKITLVIHNVMTKSIIITHMNIWTKNPSQGKHMRTSN